MARNRVSRPAPARIRMKMRDPARSLESIDRLPTAMYEAGLIHREPRLMRWAADEVGVLEITVTFVDRAAAREWPRHPTVVAYCGDELRKLVRGRPRTVRQRDYWLEVDDERLCACSASPFYMMQGPPMEREEVLWCGGCGLAVANRRWDETAGRDSWAVTYRSVYTVWLDSGLYEKWAEQQLADLGSDLNRAGRRAARDAQRRLGVPVYFELFVAKPGPNPTCLGCGRATRDIGLPTWRACRRCRLMFRHD